MWFGLCSHWIGCLPTLEYFRGCDLCRSERCPRMGSGGVENVFQGFWSCEFVGLVKKSWHRFVRWFWVCRGCLRWL